MNAIKTIKQLLPSKNHWPTFLLENRLMSFYEKQAGYRMDIKHPQTFTEKLQWYKLYYKGDGHLERIVDKYLFKDYIKEHLGEGYTIPLLGAWTDINQLEKDWNSLPEEFCLKSTLQSDGKCIKFIHDKSSIQFDTIKEELKEWLNPKKTLINSFCKAYYNATPRILAEEYMQNVKDQLFDYKFFCFNGEPKLIYVYSNESNSQGSKPEPSHCDIFDLNWNPVNYHQKSKPIGGITKPAHLKEMIEYAKKLSSNIPFIRVDFYDEGSLYIGELTLYPGGGTAPFVPNEWNYKLGEWLHLPS